MLEHAEGFLERSQAIAQALKLGMPLRDIEEYLDWLDLVRSKNKNTDLDDENKGSGEPGVS